MEDTLSNADRGHQPLIPPLHDVDRSWLPLRQAWRGRSEPGFQPGWARVTWSGRHLRYDILFAARAPRNRAHRLNEPTWELGDVCEIFVQLDDQSDYFELHVTPENQRLQSRWTKASHEAFAAQAIPLAEALIDDPDWAETHSEVMPGLWRVKAVIPGDRLGWSAAACGTPTIRTAVCRYDYESSDAPVLSSTARLREPSYHRIDDWDVLRV